jgi:hypothetical protein
MSDLVKETVTLHVCITCSGCARKLETSEALPGDSVRTGNTTQQASYWLDGMRRRIVGAAAARHWAVQPGGVYRCAHCTAAEVDKLGSTVTQERPESKDKADCG